MERAQALEADKPGFQTRNYPWLAMSLWINILPSNYGIPRVKSGAIAN